MNCLRTWATLVLGIRGTSRGSLVDQAAWIFATLGICRERCLEFKCVCISTRTYTCTYTNTHAKYTRSTHTHTHHNRYLCTDHVSTYVISSEVCVHKHGHRNIRVHVFTLVHTTEVHTMHLQTYAFRFIQTGIMQTAELTSGVISLLSDSASPLAAWGWRAP